jgi:DNA-directed RNA polymerase specialized sigma24 family protein
VVDQVEGATRHKWELTQEAFDCLLTALDRDRDVAADKYLQMRRNLVRLFEWRGCSTPDDYADETVNRCAKKIGEGEAIRDVASYSLGVGRMLLREKSRERLREPLPLEGAPEPRTLPAETKDDEEAAAACLRECLGQLSPQNRDLILRYYQGEKSERIKTRKLLGQVFGVPSNILRMRALRLREKLQLCAEKCLQRQGGNCL